MRALEAAPNKLQNSKVEQKEWDRKHGETRKAYRAFQIYLDLPGNRSIETVGEQLMCGRANCAKWSARWSWQSRARAWDLVEDERERLENIRERMLMRRRHAKAGADMQKIAAAALEELQRKAEQNLPLNLKPQEITQLIKEGAALESKARGDDLPDKQFTKINVIFGDVDEAKLGKDGS